MVWCFNTASNSHIFKQRHFAINNVISLSMLMTSYQYVISLQGVPSWQHNNNKYVS